MSNYLREQLEQATNLDQATLTLLTKSIHSLTREERKMLLGKSKTQIVQAFQVIDQLWQRADEAEKAVWFEATADSIIEKGGDRDSLDKYIVNIIGQIKVYNRVRKLCDERGVFLKSSVTQGGCAVVMMLITLGLVFALILTYLK